MSFKTLKNICYFAATFTLVVISVGAWVRLTDAGLGCPDWPGCYGILSTPDTEQELATERERRILEGDYDSPQDQRLLHP